MELNILTLCYLIGSVTFIIGLKMLSNPATARKGNLVAATGMIIAIIGTIFLYEEDGHRLGNYGWIFGGIAIGTIIGFLAAKKSKDDGYARNGEPVQWNGWRLRGFDINCRIQPPRK